MEGKKTFLKKNTVEADVESIQEKQNALIQSRPVTDKKRGVVFVNGGKYQRAVDLAKLVIGEVVPRSQEELERKEHYTKQLAVHEIDPKSEDVIPALYEILGGLIRTIKEQDDFERGMEERSKAAKNDTFGMKK